MTILEQVNDDDFATIVKNSFSLKEVNEKIGYKSYSGDQSARLKNRIEKLNLDVSHFSTISKANNNRIERNEENVFIENSTANQSTLRRWYLKGNYTPYICSICGQEPIWQGKELTLILDHINGINNDDRLENLRWVCSNCNQQLDTTGSKNPNKIRSKYSSPSITIKNYCIDCNKEISKQSLRCNSCSAFQDRIIKDRPDREELKVLIRTLPFTKIGEKYNISDNAVRKWCDGYNLPRTKKEINSYSDEEWFDI